MQEFKDLTLNMMDAAGDIARQYFRQNPDIEHKEDASPVTIADKKIEQTLRAIIESARPDDGFMGEEFGEKPSRSGLTWVIDPIDGTKSFIAGRPTFGTMIGLWEGTTPLLGSIYQPVTDELWLGCRDAQTLLNTKPIQTRQNIDLNKIRIGSTSPRHFKPFPNLTDALQDNCDFLVWGGDCTLYGMLAFGGLDVVIETGLATHDYAALPAIIEGAGGIITDWNGEDITLNSKGDVLCAANREIHAKILELIGKST